MVDPTPLTEAIASLRAGRLVPEEYAAQLYDRVEATEPDVRAWVDGPKPRARVTAEADALAERYPRPTDRPSLFGVPVGVKDIVHVDGLPTRAGSSLPPGELAGPEAAVVDRLRGAGAFVFGKTATTEFAWMAPGPTRNPHDHAHTPGGSSSGSAAAVAAGTVPLAVGSQTIGSVVRPASFCGVVGFKPSYGRVPLDGVLPLAPSVDHVGLFTRDATGMELAAAACLTDWDDPGGVERPTLGVPAGPYLQQADPVGLAAFDDQVDALRAAGYDVERVPALERIGAVNERLVALVAAEAALAHAAWFDEYGDRYAESTADLVRKGRTVSAGTLADARRGRLSLRSALAAAMDEHGIDAWVSPGAPGPAPAGIDSTGDPVMNLPWTHAGLPTVALPGGEVDGLPVGIQVAAAVGEDERLLARAPEMASALEGAA
jgi:Asp-tRNA(Asn)/Glu-tRNA(Gln) amidotransferase A subunit family amidase